MNRDEEMEQLRAENTKLRASVQRKDEEIEQLHHSNTELREGVKQAIIAIEYLQERVKALEERQAKDSHNSSLPPSSDHFVRPPKSLRHPSGKKAGGQQGPPGHHLSQVERPDAVLVHGVDFCEACQQDLRESSATLPERRQVIELPTMRVWVREHQVEEKCCPVCSHRHEQPFHSR
jgi:transposase